jgi:hypothetical protein
MKRIYCGLVALVLLTATVRAQQYSISSFSISSGGDTSVGGGYSISGTIGQFDAGGTLSGGSYTVDPGFWNMDAAPAPAPETIFDNISGSVNGGEGVTTSTWLADKFCIGAQPYQLESISLLLNSQDSSGAAGPPVSVRLQLYANDPASGKPSATTGLLLDLNGMTNPITLLHGQQMVMWTPHTPFTLSAGTCYWVVLSLDSGVSIGELDSFSAPTGSAAAFGRASSFDSGATWPLLDNADNRKMLILATALPVVASDSPALSVARTGADLQFRFTTVSGRSYVLQSITDLLTGSWASVVGTAQSGTGGTVQQTLSNAFVGPRQFYRIQQQ